MKYLKKYWEILIILFLGLVPLLWYKKPNSLALGHDMGFPIDPIVFFNDRLFLWTERVGLGWDQTLGSAALLIHGLEALIASFGVDIFTTQKIIFIFWFVLPGLAMYYFVSTLHKEKEQWFLRLSASIFYMFNHFLIQGWFIAERTKISLFVALPILLGLTISIIERKISILKGLALMSLVFFIFNGGGGLPLYGGIILTISLSFLFFGFVSLRKNFKGEWKRLVAIFLGMCSSFILANFYWILPQVIGAMSSYKQILSTIGGISGVITWSSEISKYASILNVFRLQGIPDWYDNKLHPFSGHFINNPILILASFLLPVIVFSSLFLIKKVPKYRKYIIFFNILAVTGVIFTAGSHPPFGSIYNAFLTFIPGFAIFRSPFYKFAPALWFAYAYLFAFSFYFLSEKFSKFKLFSRIVVLLLILIYSFPLFTGSFFKWRAPLSTMVTLPPNVKEFGKWANKNLTYQDRVLSFPRQNHSRFAAVFDWGYWSTAPVEGLLTNESIIANDTVMTSPERKLTEEIYRSILNGTDDWKQAANILGINYFLLHKDFNSTIPGFRTDDPSAYENKFKELGLREKITFGDWVLYSIPLDANKISVSSPYLFGGSKNLLDDEFFEMNSILSALGSNKSFIFNGNNAETGKEIYPKTFQIENCIFCDKSEKKFVLQLQNATFLPGSIFYPLVQYKNDKLRKSMSTNTDSEIEFYLGTSLKRVTEIKQLVDLRRDERIISSVIENLNYQISTLENIIDKMPKNSSTSKLTILNVNNFLREETRLLGDISKNSTPNISMNIIALNSNIYRIYQKNHKYEFKYPDDNEKIYLININPEGFREVLLESKNMNGITIDGLFIDNKIASLAGTKKGNYLSFGRWGFYKGSHELKFVLGNIPNLLLNSKQPLEFSINPQSPECRNFNAKVEPNKIYNLKFNYNTELSSGGDNGPFIRTEQITGEDTIVSETQLKSSGLPQTYDSKITTTNVARELKVFICPSPGSETSSTMQINNLSLKSFLMPKLLLASEKFVPVSNPSITPEEINQTHYRVLVRGATAPYLLVLNNTFNPNWLASINSKALNPEKHVTANGFANGWIIEKNGDYSIDLTYKPQKFFYLGWVATGVFIFAIVVYLLLSLFKKNANRN